MGDSLNALQMLQARTTGALPAPVVANPLTAISSGTQVAGQITDLRQRQFNLQQAQLQPAYQSMRMLMATNPDPSWDDVNAALAQSARIGGNVDGLVANATEIAGKGGKPVDFMRATALGGMSPETQGQLVGPQRMSQQTAAGTYYGTTPGLWAPGAGTFQPAGFAARGLSPTEQMQPYTVMGPDGTPITVPAGTAYGGGGAPGVPGGGGGGDINSLPKAQFLQAVAQRESGGDPTALNYVAKADPTAYARGATASGKYQMVNSTWQQGAAWAGVDTTQYPTAMSAPEAVQDKVASAVYDHSGTTPWQKGGQNWVRGQGGQYTLQTVPQGQGGGAVAAAPGGGGGGPQSGAFVGATSAQPVAGGGNVQPAGGGVQYLPASPGGGGQGGGGVLAGGYSLPSPGLQPELDAGAKQHAADIGNLATLPTRIQPLMSALNVLKANPDLTTGAGQDQWNTWMGALKGMGLPLPDWAAADKTPAWQELGKYLMQNTRAMPGANQSDMSRLQAEVSSPHIDQQRDAIMELSARQVGLERFQLAGLKYVDSQFSDPTAAASHSGTYRLTTAPWLAKLDPTAFAADLMEPKATQRYYQSLTSAQQARYRESLVAAKQLFGIQLPIPQGGNGGG
jgi:hypothetical protein